MEFDIYKIYIFTYLHIYIDTGLLIQQLNEVAWLPVRTGQYGCCHPRYVAPGVVGDGVSCVYVSNGRARDAMHTGRSSTTKMC